MDTYNILHLSDLHIGKGYEEHDKLAEKIGDTLQGQRVDVVIFTGDIFDNPPVKYKKTKDGPIDNVAKERLIATAVNFFDKLLAHINRGISKLTKENFWFVAGNHDLYRQKKNDTWSLFDGFLEKFYGDSVPKAYKRKQHMVIKVDSANQKVLLGFNSNIEYKNGTEQLVGHITEEQLERVGKYLETHQEYQHYDKIAFFHHPCNFFEERGINNIDGIMNNSLDVRKKLAEWNVKLVLHGHKHWARTSIYRPAAGQKIYMFAGGGIGTLRDKCSGNIIEIGEKICLKEIVSENSNKFGIKPVDILDNYMEGLLFKAPEKWGRSYTSDEQRVLKMIDKLYLSYEQLNLLQNNPSNLCILENSIKYTLEIDGYDDLFGDISEAEWDEVKKILDNQEILGEERDELQNNPVKKCYVAFALLGRFFTNLYEAITRTDSVRWDEKNTEFNLGSSCYYVYFKLKKNADGAQARQELDKIMEGFQEQLYELKDFLYCIELNIRNVFLELRDNHNNVHHCDFHASVPRLIQLLTGTNIYCHEHSFVRELIQNSIDAISFRDKQNEYFNKQIEVELGDDGEEQYFKIRDYGIGMKQEIIERYFATLGRSYYKEYTERRKINYNSVSNFGIGFLSVFKPCRKIIIKTKHFVEKKYHELEINSAQGHYMISSPQEEFLPGTEIICYFKNQNVCKQEIIAYIKKIMLDIKYNIEIQSGAEDKQTIRAREIRKEEYHNVIFIPFDEDDKRIVKSDSHDEMQPQERVSNYMKSFRHGILIRPEQEKNAGVDILSAGILLNNAGLEDIFGKNTDKLQYMKVTMNFPPNWLDIDVSREKINGIRTCYIKDIRNFKEDICGELKRQVGQVFKYNRDILLGFFKDASMLVKVFEQNGEGNEKQSVWNLKVHFEEREIKFYLNHTQEETILGHLFHKWAIDMVAEHNNNESKRYHDAIKLMYKSLSQDEAFAIRQMLQERKHFTNSREALQKLGLNVVNLEDRYLPLVPAIFLAKVQESQEETDDENELHGFIEAAVWESCTVQDVIEKNGNLFSVDYDNREQDRIAMESDSLQRRVDILVQRYKIPFICQRNTYQYDFVWEYIILNTLKEYGLSFKDNGDIQKNVEENYKHLRDTIKIVYLKRTGKLIDIYTIASCYMSVLMDIPKESLKFQEGVDATAKYCWILDVGLSFLYMWILSEDGESENGKPEKNISDMLYKLYNQKELGSLLDYEIKHRHIQLLASQEKRTFDVLCFAELLRWIDDYIEKKILFIKNLHGTGII